VRVSFSVFAAETPPNDKARERGARTRHPEITDFLTDSFSSSALNLLRSIAAILDKTRIRRDLGTSARERTEFLRASVEIFLSPAPDTGQHLAIC